MGDRPSDNEIGAVLDSERIKYNGTPPRAEKNYKVIGNMLAKLRYELLGDRLMAGRVTLNHEIQVRALVTQLKTNILL